MTTASRTAKLVAALCAPAMLICLQLPAGAVEESGAKKAAKQFTGDVKEAGKQVGQTAKKVGKDIGHGTTKAARSVKREFKEDFVDQKDDDGQPRKQERAGRK